jgi:hypothetical protein
MSSSILKDSSILNTIKEWYKSGKDTISEFIPVKKNPSSYFTIPAASPPPTTYTEYVMKYMGYSRTMYLLGLFIFIILLIVFYVKNPYHLANKYFGLVIIFLGIMILFALLVFTSSLYDNPASMLEENPFFASVKYSMIFLLFAGISVGLIALLVHFSGKITSISSFASLLTNIIIVIVLMMLVYKVISYSTIFRSSPLFRLFVNTILYIPCLVGGVAKNLFWELFWMFKIKPFGYAVNTPKFSIPNFTQTLANEYANTKNSYLVILAISLLLFGCYFAYPYAENKYLAQGGKQLLDEPIYLNGEKQLGTYEYLNGSDTFNYQYGISFWFYLDSNNTTSENMPILSFGNKLAVLYNPSQNLLQVQVEEKNESLTNETQTIYQKTGVYLQKWNHMIINYTGGTLDIFLNGDLVKSSINIVPYMKLDTLVVGKNKGLNGGICNVVYFNKPLVVDQIHNLYEFFMVFVVLTGIASLLLFLLTPVLKKMMHGVK